MKYPASTFFSNFSVSELIEKNNSRSGIICLFGSNGGVGTGSAFDKSDESHYRNHNSFSCYIRPHKRKDFDEFEIVNSLKEDIEQEIIKSGAKIINRTDLDELRFYVVYGDINIQGHIELTSHFDGENFKLDVNLSEVSKSEKEPLIECNNAIYKPSGNYYVIVFDLADINGQQFYEKGRNTAEMFREIWRQKYLTNPAEGKSIIENMDYAVMYSWSPIPPRMRQLLQEKMGKDFEIFSEYEKYGRIFFLNELALRMYGDIGEKAEVLKIIPESDMGKLQMGPTFKYFYLPND